MRNRTHFINVLHFHVILFNLSKIEKSLRLMKSKRKKMRDSSLTQMSYGFKKWDYIVLLSLVSMMADFHKPVPGCGCFTFCHEQKWSVPFMIVLCVLTVDYRRPVDKQHFMYNFQRIV